MSGFASTARSFGEIRAGQERVEVSSSNFDDIVWLNEEGKIAIRWEELVPNKLYPIEAYGKTYLVVRRPGDLVQIHELAR